MEENTNTAALPQSACHSQEAGDMGIPRETPGIRIATPPAAARNDRADNGLPRRSDALLAMTETERFASCHSQEAGEARRRGNPYSPAGKNGLPPAAARNDRSVAAAPGKPGFEEILQDPDYRRAFDERVRAAVGRRFRTVDAQRAEMRELAGDMARYLGLRPGPDGRVELAALRAALGEEARQNRGSVPAPADGPGERIAAPPAAARNDRADNGLPRRSDALLAMTETERFASCHSEEAGEARPRGNPYSPAGENGSPPAAARNDREDNGLPRRSDALLAMTETERFASCHSQEAGEARPRGNPYFPAGENGSPSAAARNDRGGDDDPPALRASFRDAVAEGEALRALYPGFDLGRELADPRFAGVLVSLQRGGVPGAVRLAYEAAHRRELLGGALRAAVACTAAQVAEGVRSGALRPAENGGGAAADTRPDPGHLSPQQRKDIRERVMRGERVTF